MQLTWAIHGMGGKEGRGAGVRIAELQQHQVDVMIANGPIVTEVDIQLGLR